MNDDIVASALRTKVNFLSKVIPAKGITGFQNQFHAIKLVPVALYLLRTELGTGPETMQSSCADYSGPWKKLANSQVQKLCSLSDSK